MLFGIWTLVILTLVVCVMLYQMLKIHEFTKDRIHRTWQEVSQIKDMVYALKLRTDDKLTKGEVQKEKDQALKQLKYLDKITDKLTDIEKNTKQ
tara:strand:+ start:714 stop:995 length:282 start_codon:yes stop_codon:yes gene_type:complete